jgi:hypothetical protein
MGDFTSDLPLTIRNKFVSYPLYLPPILKHIDVIDLHNVPVAFTLQEISESMLYLRSTSTTSRYILNTFPPHSINLSALIEPFIQSLQHDPKRQRACDRNDNRRCINTHRGNISRGVLIRIHVADVNARGVADGVDKSQCGCSFGRRTRKGVADPGETDDVSGVTSSGHQHHGKISGGERGCSRCDDECEKSEVEWDSDMPESFPRAIRMPRSKERCENGKCIRRNRQEERDDIRLIQRSNHLQLDLTPKRTYRWEEICDAAG